MNANKSTKGLSKRQNFFFQIPSIIAAHRACVKLGIIRAKSTDARTQQLLAADVRRNAAKLKAAIGELSAVDQAAATEALKIVLAK